MALVLALSLAITPVAGAHEKPGSSAPEGAGGGAGWFPDMEYLKAVIAEAKALDGLGRGGFHGRVASVPQCVFRYAGCISGCSSAQTTCYVAASPDDEKRTNYTACVDSAHRCRLRCCDLACARALKLEAAFPCDF